MKNKLIEFYIEYLNDFLTTDGMGRQYGITSDECIALIALGKKYCDEYVETPNSELIIKNK